MFDVQIIFEQFETHFDNTDRNAPGEIALQKRMFEMTLNIKKFAILPRMPGDLGKMGNKVGMQSIQVIWLAWHTLVFTSSCKMCPCTQ